MTDGRGSIAPHIPHLRRFARLLVRDANRADALVERSLIRANSEASAETLERELRTRLFCYLYEACLNAAADAPERHPDDDVTSIAASGRASGGEQSCLTDMKRIVARLPREQREALILVAVMRVTYEEAATICGRTVVEIRANLAAARCTVHDLTFPRLGVGKRLAG